MTPLDEITQFLRAHVGGAPQTIDTHISRVVIGAERAYKIKKPVSFSYLDFSTPEKRAAAARTEYEINRRTAPHLYLGTRRVSREADGRLALDGAGDTIETIVEMRSFDQADVFDAMAQRGALSPDLMTRLTERIAAFHRDAPPSMAHGGAAGILGIIDMDAPALAACGLATSERISALDSALRARLRELAALLDARRDAGKVRRCHGDLTLRNICLFEGEPTPFDALEFDEALGTIDVLYDLAFLLMDLIHRGLERLANLVFNRYFDATDETDGLPALPFFMALRATIRAHVTATQARGAEAGKRATLAREAQSYFDLAERLLRPCEAALVAVGGYSGSGKSTLAAALAPSLGPAPGARILSSDRIRKRMLGAQVLERLPQKAYASDVSERVYASMRAQAARILALGCAVVADAVFGRPELASAIEEVARAAGSPFTGLWLAGERGRLAARIAGRRNDPSDATEAVLDAQIAKGRAPEQWRTIETSADAESVAVQARAALPRSFRT